MDALLLNMRSYIDAALSHLLTRLMIVALISYVTWFVFLEPKVQYEHIVVWVYALIFFLPIVALSVIGFSMAMVFGFLAYSRDAFRKYAKPLALVGGAAGIFFSILGVMQFELFDKFARALVSAFWSPR